MGVLLDNQEEKSLETEKARSIKKWMGKETEDGEMENKRGHWRQIKDTQLND